MKRNQIVPDFVTNIANGLQSTSGCTAFTNVGGPVNTLSSNKDNSVIAVAGRTILKLYSVEETCFKEKINLRVGRRQGLNLSCADVAWNQVNENLIATAATNGAIVAWDLSIPSRNKQMAIFTEHKRTVTKVCFHSSEPGRLLSGSQDCTMKMFDMRKKECVTTFTSKSDGVRCVQFSPHEYFHFAASFDNGTVQLWDYRNTSSCMLQFIAHKGSVYTLEWHPDPKEKQRLATGGRDNMIKIWDLIDHKMHENMNIPTNSLVAVTRWRSHRKEQIASVAMMLDHSINVWDMRRPYMPFAHFTEHTDVTTDIVWKKNDPEILFSCSKDGTLYQHSIRDAVRPSEHCNMSGLSVGARGYIGFSNADNTSYMDTHSYPKNKGIGRFGFRGVVGVSSAVSQQKNEANQWVQGNTTTNMNIKFAKFLNSKSDVGIHFESANRGRLDSLDVSSSRLRMAAMAYKLQGLPFKELCSHNALFAEQIGLNFDANVWRYLKLFYGGEVPNKIDRAISNSFHSGSIEKTGKSSWENSTHGRNMKNGFATAESNGEESEQHSDPETEHYLTDIAKGNATSEQDCYYSEEDDISDPEFGGRGGLGGMSSGTELYMEQQDWEYVPDDGHIGDGVLPSEAFQRRLVLHSAEGLEGQIDSIVSGDEIVGHASPITIPNASIPQLQDVERKRRKSIKNVGPTSAPSHSSSSPQDHSPVIPVVYVKPYENSFLTTLRKTELLAEMFLAAMERDPCVQIIVCATVVLGHYFPSLSLPIDKPVMENWQTVYLDLISRYELWNHYTEIINLSRIPSINNLNSSSTIHTSCGCCHKRMPASHPWICSKHSDSDHKHFGLQTGIKCALCQMVVKSLYTWCQGCCHGGHLNCMKEWFKYPHSKGLCPTGCGHACSLAR